MGTLLPVYCDHGVKPPSTRRKSRHDRPGRLWLAGVLPGSVVTVPWCKSAKGVPREHHPVAPDSGS